MGEEGGGFVEAMNVRWGGGEDLVVLLDEGFGNHEWSRGGCGGGGSGGGGSRRSGRRWFAAWLAVAGHLDAYFVLFSGRSSRVSVE